MKGYTPPHTGADPENLKGWGPGKIFDNLPHNSANFHAFLKKYSELKFGSKRGGPDPLNPPLDPPLPHTLMVTSHLHLNQAIPLQ